MAIKKKTPRMYENLWERLKQDKKLLLEVNSSGKNRIRRMIIKEKDMDQCWKLECLEQGNVYRIKIEELPAKDPDRVRLLFTLVLRHDCII